jgi:hypothetical protein
MHQPMWSTNVMVWDASPLCPGANEIDEQLELRLSAISICAPGNTSESRRARHAPSANDSTLRSLISRLVPAIGAIVIAHDCVESTASQSATEANRTGDAAMRCIDKQHRRPPIYAAALGPIADSSRSCVGSPLTPGSRAFSAIMQLFIFIQYNRSGAHSSPCLLTWIGRVSSLTL